jgi:DNA-binding CsgD family transcriptional regulator
MTLTDRVAQDAEVARIVQDLSISNREISRRLGYNESVI